MAPERAKPKGALRGGKKKQVPKGALVRKKGKGGNAARGGGKPNTPTDEELQGLDWDVMDGWKSVKFNPNQLMLGAQEEGFMSLEELDPSEVRTVQVDINQLDPVC